MGRDGGGGRGWRGRRGKWEGRGRVAYGRDRQRHMDMQEMEKEAERQWDRETRDTDKETRRFLVPHVVLSMYLTSAGMDRFDIEFSLRPSDTSVVSDLDDDSALFL